MIPDVLSLYRKAPLAVQAHVWGRWFTCPFPLIAEFVPPRGRVLEVGCGYGLFSCYLALGTPTRTVLGVDVDLRKIVHAQFAAQRARGRSAHVEFQLAPPGEIPEGPWDAIVIVDVLYLLDPDAQAGLLHSCAERLALGGALVVKEMATEPRWKVRWNEVQETLAVRVLRITAGEELNFPEPADLGRWMAEDGLAIRHERLDRGYPHPHHLVMGSRRRSV